MFFAALFVFGLFAVVGLRLATVASETLGRWRVVSCVGLSVVLLTVLAAVWRRHVARPVPVRSAALVDEGVDRHIEYYTK